MTDLGTVGGDPCSAALSVNSRGQVVGASESAAGGCNEWTTALLWENGAPGVDLNSLVPSGSGAYLSVAFWTNDRGEIVAGGNPPSCDLSANCSHAYVLIPCDENHADLEGCDYETVDAQTAAQVRPAQITESSAPANGAKFAPTEIMTRYRSALTRRNQRFGALPQK
jgi:probable HAF family extracellular repeat protein